MVSVQEGYSEPAQGHPVNAAGLRAEGPESAGAVAAGNAGVAEGREHLAVGADGAVSGVPLTAEGRRVGAAEQGDGDLLAVVRFSGRGLGSGSVVPS